MNTLKLNLKLIHPKWVFYDLGEFGFRTLIAFIMIAFVLLARELGLNMFLIVLLMFVLMYSLAFFLKRRNGWWIKNYSIIGEIELSENSVRVIHKKIETFHLVNHRMIRLKHDYFQNYRSSGRDASRTGIATLCFKNEEGIEKCYSFLVTTETEYELFLAIRDSWKKNGISIWT